MVVKAVMWNLVRGYMKRYEIEYRLYQVLLGSLAVIVIIILLASIYRTISVGVGSGRDVECCVTDKGIKRVNGSDVYLIYGETDGNVSVYQITDSLLAFRFNSSDVYAGIKVGKTYKFTVKGDRVRLFSWYPNVYNVREVK